MGKVYCQRPGPDEYLGRVEPGSGKVYRQRVGPARDEYLGAGSWTDHRGYYDAQNWNAADNPTPGFSQVDSIMTTGTLLNNAYDAHTSSPSSLEMIGWRDSDGDGILDVLDVPLTLSGSGFVDPGAGEYRFIGTSSVQTLPNLNSSGLQNDITINEISRAEFTLLNFPKGAYSVSIQK